MYQTCKILLEIEKLFYQYRVWTIVMTLTKKEGWRCVYPYYLMCSSFMSQELHLIKISITLLTFYDENIHFITI